MKILYRIVFFLFLSNFANAQGLWKHIVEHPDSGIKRYDTTYVKPLLNQLTLRYFFNVKAQNNAVLFLSSLLPSCIAELTLNPSGR